MPQAARSYLWRAVLRQLFDDRSLTTAAVAGSTRLTEWLTAAHALGLTALNKFCDTLERWLDKIANDFVSRSSKGSAEGFNNGLRAITPPNLRNAQLPPLSTASPRPFRKTSNTRINFSG